MAANVSDEDISRAVLGFVTEGTFPESEDVVAAEFQGTVVQTALHEFSKAREEVENEIRTLSRETATDVEGWVIQARKLHEDIERSRLTAREIVRQHEEGKILQTQTQDATNKVETMRDEIAFNQSLSETLLEIRRIDRLAASIHDALAKDQLIKAIDTLEELDSLLAQPPLPLNCAVIGILSGNAAKLRHSVIAALRQKWDILVKVDARTGTMTIAANHSELEALLSGLTKLGVLGSVTNTFNKSLRVYILDPILLPKDLTVTRTLSLEGDTLKVVELSEPSIATVSSSILSLLGYLKARLPATVTTPLSATLIPYITSSLISRWLSPAIPVGVVGMGDFQSTIDSALQLAADISNAGWHEPGDLISWTNQIPRLWLQQRRVRSLDEVRNALSASGGDTRKVERIEKQNVYQNDEMFTETTMDDDWDAGWTDEKDEQADTTAKAEVADEEEDVSAWGLEDDDSTALEPDNKEKPTEEEDDPADAWDWGDENEDEEPISNETAITPDTSKQINGKENKPSPKREIILREFYTITDIPEAILAIITNHVADADSLKQPEYAKLKIASSAPALLALPTLVIAMYKATAPLFYSQKFKGGQMFVYNDSMYLAEQLRQLMETHDLQKLKPDIETLEKFGRIAYGKEMQTQRTILSDLLDVGQGFSNCSAQPYLGECENAISATVDRVRGVHKEWQSILSHSALLQSIGSLLSTIIDKMIIDIEDLSDISEAESQRLAAFCNDISKLEDLFLPEAKDENEPVPMTAMYVSNWLKFQYLMNILESSLADIKYLWTEGELKLEFSPEEVVDLINALFADSDHRRRAITEMRRASRS
ncbi:hypothetical protein AJ80_05383 [Polytolypa hystricis UAMH7299]|uniref:ZW10 C-terminal helical domain-containing protein n=1 Tax=Polytolypa hystricis (strain UAMH7299) TaxID=1447883 RepID=A0A2B7Y4S9_POLH7|nr:hypothetical protein AJ80_05383 [Polytolypa hystricis UAMH7299]